MKKTLLALVLAFILICSFACAPANTTGTTTAQPNIAEGDCLVFLSVKETERYYKTVTNADDIGAIAEAVETALENATVKPPLAEGELAKSRRPYFQIRILNGGSVVGEVTVYDDGITSGTEYQADTTELISALAEIYEGIDSEEQPAA